MVAKSLFPSSASEAWVAGLRVGSASSLSLDSATACPSSITSLSSSMAWVILPGMVQKKNRRLHGSNKKNGPKKIDGSKK